MTTRSVLAWLQMIAALTVASWSALGHAAGAAFDQPAENAALDNFQYPDMYQDLKAAAAILEDQESLQHAQRERELPAAMRARLADMRARLPVDVYPCGWEPPITATDRREAALENVARRVALVAHELRRRGYPAELLEPPLRAFERRMLERFGAIEDRSGRGPIRDIYEVLVADLESARQRSATALPPISEEDSCEDIHAYRDHNFPIRYVLRTIPANGRVWVISEFRHIFCRIRNTGPWDVEACRYWREIHPDQRTHLAGRHRIQISWSDGGVSRQERTFDAYGWLPVVTVRLTRD